MNKYTKMLTFVMILTVLATKVTITYADGFDEEKSALDYFDQKIIDSMDLETKEMYAGFIVGDINTSETYIISYEDMKTQTVDSIEVSKEQFYSEFLKENINMPIDIALEKYDQRVFMENTYQNAKGQTNYLLPIIDIAVSGQVLETTLFNSAGSTSYDYIVRNDVSSTATFTTKRAVNGIGTGSNASIVNKYYIAYHEYNVDMFGNTFFARDEYEPTCKMSSGYAFDYSIDDLMYNNKSVLSVYCQPNVSNLTVFDAYGKGAHRSMSVSASLSIGLEGPSLTLSPSTSWTINSTHVQHRR